ncbi:MAG: class I SAM-dependent methyltransferase [Gemmataceae bacterium]|nr:class I SAM-dependent methyltransferase [Gemmataceae bacterium]
MGCGMSYFKWLAETDRVRPGGRLLDIGESCLIDATAADIEWVWDRFGCTLPPADRPGLAAEYAYRSTLNAHPTTPTLFLSEALDPTSVGYDALDMVTARVAHKFDLNVHTLARARRGTFDLVVNFGTTEHVVNQFNSLRVIHDAAAVGGYIFHQVPATGFINHGYFTYDALLFRELAAANGYDLLDVWFGGPKEAGNVLTNAAHHPTVLDAGKIDNNLPWLEKSPVPNSTINVLLRKTRDAPFAVGLEIKTAAGKVDPSAGFANELVEPDPAPGGPPAASDWATPPDGDGWLGRMLAKAS